MENTPQNISLEVKDLKELQVLLFSTIDELNRQNARIELLNKKLQAFIDYVNLNLR